jgi:hypothetical protein
MKMLRGGTARTSGLNVREQQVQEAVQVWMLVVPADALGCTKSTYNFRITQRVIVSS